MRARRLLLVLPILLSTVGCGTLFNKQRSDTATAAQKKFTDVKLADLLKEERKHHGVILTREIAIAQRQTTAARDARLIAIVMSDDVKKSLGDAIGTRLKELRGDDQKIVNLLIRIENDEEGLRFAGDQYRIRRRATDPKLECRASEVQVSERARDAWDDVQERCADLATLRADLMPLATAGLLGETAVRIATTERARIELATQLAAAEEDVKKKAEALAAAQQKKGALDAAELSKLKTSVTGIRIPSADQLSSTGIEDVRVAAALKWVEIQRAAVEQILATATSGATELPPGTSDALQIAAVLPSLAAQIRETRDFPRVSALVMESQRLRIDADRYRRQLARVDEELALQRAKLLRLRTETSVLSDAASKLETGTLDAALGRYAEAWTVARIPGKEIEWKLIGLAHERALDQSDAAIAQWEALVRAPLEALVASASSGLTPEEISGLLHALELGALAVGL